MVGHRPSWNLGQTSPPSAVANRRRSNNPSCPAEAPEVRANLDGMTDVRETGLQVFRELLPGAVPDGDVRLRDGKFGDELLEIGVDNVFGRLWGREGLSRRDRSLVTLRDRKSTRLNSSHLVISYA